MKDNPKFFQQRMNEIPSERKKEQERIFFLKFLENAKTEERNLERTERMSTLIISLKFLLKKQIQHIFLANYFFCICE